MKYSLTVVTPEGKLVEVEVDANGDAEAQRLGEKYGFVVIIACYNEPEWEDAWEAGR